MYNMNRKLRVVKNNYAKLRGELIDCLKEAITSYKDINIMLGYTSDFKPMVFNLNTEVNNIDYYDDIIYTVRNNGLCLMEWFDNDLGVIGDIIGATFEAMRMFASELMEKPYDDVSYEDILIAIDTPLVNEKLLRERARIILESYDFRTMATFILDAYMQFLIVNYCIIVTR